MQYSLVDAFLTMLFLSLWVVWLYLAFRMLRDILRSSDLDDRSTAGYVFLVAFIPFFGILVYLLRRGGGVHTRGGGLAGRRGYTSGSCGMWIVVIAVVAAVLGVLSVLLYQLVALATASGGLLATIVLVTVALLVTLAVVPRVLTPGQRKTEERGR